MSLRILGLTIALLSVFAAGPFVTAVEAASKHNGSCMGFAGSVGGYKYAGLKCQLDTAPGDWKIRHSVKERDDAEEYKNLLRVPKRPFRCTLTKGSTVRGAVTTHYYNIESCN